MRKHTFSVNVKDSASITMSSYKDSISENNNLTEAILQSFELNELIPRFKREQIDLECLLLMTENDIEKLIPQINLRIKFRAKLIAWRMLKGDDLTIYDDVQSEISVNSKESKTIANNIDEKKNRIQLNEQSKIKTSIKPRSSSPNEHSLKKAAEHWKSVEALKKSHTDKNKDNDKAATGKQLLKHHLLYNETGRLKERDYDADKAAFDKQSKHVTFYTESGCSKGRKEEMRNKRCTEVDRDTRHCTKNYKSTDRGDERDNRSRDIGNRPRSRHLLPTPYGDVRMIYQDVSDTSANLKDHPKLSDRDLGDRNSVSDEMRLKKTVEKVDERYREDPDREPSNSTIIQKHKHVREDVQQTKSSKDLANASLSTRSERSECSRKNEDIKIGVDTKKRIYVDKKHDDEDSPTKKKFYTENGHKSTEIPERKENNIKCYSETCNLKCFACQKTGHMKRQCPKRYECLQRSVICYFCQEAGHFARFCKARLYGSTRTQGGYRSS